MAANTTTTKRGRRKDAVHSSGNPLLSSLQQGRSKPRYFWERMLWIAAFVIIICIIVDICYKEINIRSLRNQLAETERLLYANRIEYERLLLEREFMQSDAYIERMARQTLGWLRPGDIIFKKP